MLSWPRNVRFIDSPLILGVYGTLVVKPLLLEQSVVYILDENYCTDRKMLCSIILTITNNHIHWNTVALEQIPRVKDVDNG